MLLGASAHTRLISPSTSRSSARPVCGYDVASNKSWATRASRGAPRHPLRSVLGSAIAGRAPVVTRATAECCKLRFEVHQETQFGDVVKVCGNLQELGCWDVGSAPTMSWTEGHVWVYEMEVSPDSYIEFKYVLCPSSGEHTMEGGENRVLPVDSSATAVASGEFGNTSETSIERFGTLGVEDHAGNGAHEHVEDYGTTDVEERPVAEEPDASSALESTTSEWSAEEEGAGLGWVGKDTVFMQSNDHKRERSGTWDSSGLDGPAKRLVEGDRDAGSWRKKLEVLKSLLVDDAPDGRPGSDALAHAAVYVQWINAGAIECVEDGGHHRPNRHAELSRAIFRSLEWVIADSKRTFLDKLLCRKIISKLPAFSEAFTSSTPLTRIRDIAHRNDIPSELKREIKHTIQNKLHRNAGPEDLVATEAMLRRVTETPGEYPEAFIQEFKLFTSELREFFGAGAVSELLDALRPSLDDSGNAAVDQFLSAKARVDAREGEDDMQELMDTLHRLTTVRATLVAGLSSGLRNDAPDSALVMRQKWRIAEIRLESYAFVLLSRMLNRLSELGGPSFLARSHEKEWALPIGAVVLALRHMGLGSVETRECLALEQELAAWQDMGQFHLQSNALRLKASVERAQRLVERYCDGLLSIYPTPVSHLGRGLGIEKRMVSVFTESEIRESLVFQASKMLELLLRSCREVAQSAPWEALVGGSGWGKLVACDRITPHLMSGLREDTVLLVTSADGDEEISTSGGYLRGVILCQALPHLSHLGVRARQERIPFVTCDDGSTLRAHVAPLEGKAVQLDVSAAAVALRPSPNGPQAPGYRRARGTPAPRVTASTDTERKERGPTRVLSFDEVSLEWCGAKANACAKLARIAAQPDSGFKAQAGVVVPFGALDAAVDSAGGDARGRFYGLLDQIEAAGSDTRRVEELCTELRRVVQGLWPVDGVTEEVSARLKAMKAPIILRSSANVEDLEGVSGAGLYDSVGGVDPEDVKAVRRAITQVWASLYTSRAVMSRRAAGISQKDARMAVLAMPMIDPETSFVLHTASPINRDSNLVYAELAPGLGETLASGVRGSPWRLEVDKTTGLSKTLAFANFSVALTVTRPSGGGHVIGESLYDKPREQTPVGDNYSRVVDYSKEDLSVDPTSRERLGRRLSDAAIFLEKEFGGPQDVEGCVLGGELYILQSRPQP